ncbi:hypothetical protein AB0P16_15595, partial [Dietzia maris]|uniref:hypothetical protein n=1 Tax=Dietzia maris TaxID=37915 RepID=UPI00343CF2EB
MEEGWAQLIIAMRRRDKAGYSVALASSGKAALPDLECVDPVLELSGVDERPQYVVLEVAEA